MHWTWRDKTRMAAGYWAFSACDALWRVVFFCSFKHRIGHIMTYPWAWNFLIWLAAEGYCYGDWRRGDLPPKAMWSEPNPPPWKWGKPS